MIADIKYNSDQAPSQLHLVFDSAPQGQVEAEGKGLEIAQVTCQSVVSFGLEWKLLSGASYRDDGKQSIAYHAM